MGALMIGTILAAAYVSSVGEVFPSLIAISRLWGVSCVQTYEGWSHFQYFGMYRNTDDLRLKVIVILVFLLDTLQQVFVTHTLYEYLVTHYYDPTNLGVVEWSLLAQVAPSGLIALIVQS
ncbi:hypothetical protein IW262DRAFT_1469096 [Armillaria fumosa]|nr:hypothetical protein IW262DRAFT_1469096 [Armillaria fumosa]